MNNSMASVRAASLEPLDNGVPFEDDATGAHTILGHTVSRNDAVATADADAANIANACKVKLCGLKREQDMDAALAAGPDAVGFIIDFPQSHRSISAERVAELVRYMKTRADETGVTSPAAVGVFVDQPAGRVAQIAREADLDVIQLHGHEDEDYLAELRELVTMPIMQAFKVREATDVAQAVESSADMVLLDAGAGDGKSFDWSLVAEVDRPFMLAGGLSAENVVEAIRATHPFGVDMSSGIETERLKDPVKMLAAVKAVREMADSTKASDANDT
ncbi:phosphoribosylanthranilate isomerase [Bifidobacterium sp. ESL0704]|uniref:phosphoribosylanthranilate isomerase n=1 Tax=Bifidobacterium sp. ESL0704 TaxID=2983219 RepID=UPI0023F8E843|nr:phosphoribosylanthranilate isomerase [Bifidobacterium sp. ESL0704]WEV52805.1 phosphoribosylanthranilate isomerase [Bifidobacterium sp. ESL0704]